MRDLIFSLMHDLALPTFLRILRVRNREITVLMFHRISDESDPLWPPMPVASFKRLMKELSEKTCVVSLEKIEEIGRYPDKPLIALSFDDGYPDFLQNAVQILTDLGLPANLNICPDLIDTARPPWTQILSVFLLQNAGKSLQLPNGKILQIEERVRELYFLRICNELCLVDDRARNTWIASLVEQIPSSKMPKLMNWDQVRECAGRGIHIGSHGLSHPNMNKISDEDILGQEIEGSKRRIYQEVGVNPRIFAFPSGLYNELSMGIVKKSGYKVALLCDDLVGLFTDGHHKKGFYIFPRINISGTNWKEEDLRLLGLHQKLKSVIKRTPYTLQQS